MNAETKELAMMHQASTNQSSGITTHRPKILIHNPTTRIRMTPKRKHTEFKATIAWITTRFT